MDCQNKRTLFILVYLIPQNLKALQNIGGFFLCLEFWGLSQRLKAGSGSSAGSGSDTGSVLAYWSQDTLQQPSRTLSSNF
jgi:hypothetical protein